jgi:hypothetical protein
MGAACAGLEGHVPGEATDQRVSAPGDGRTGRRCQ